MEWLKNADEPSLVPTPVGQIVGQKCNDLFMYVSYQNATISWRDMNDTMSYGPWYYGTDHGMCCFFNGEANMEEWPNDSDYEVSAVANYF